MSSGVKQLKLDLKRRISDSRAIWVSVTIFVGMRLSISICSGRMSWVIARVSVMTNMFSSKEYWSPEANWVF